MSIPVGGLHHVTAIASDPQRNLDFYVALLGLRLVKRTINFDDPGTYHFYYGDSRGTPGTILTFFPWPNAWRGRPGTGQIEATAFSIAPESVGYWLERLKENHVSAERAPERFEQQVIRFADPDGMMLELVASKPEAEVEPWAESTVPAEHSLRGFHSVSAALEGYERTAKLLTEVFDYKLVQEKGNRFRFCPPDATGPGRMIDLLCMPDTQCARGGGGTVHHIAFRTAVFDEEDLIRRAHELADFVSEAAAHYAFDAEKVAAVGYSNGANVAGGILLLRPGVLCGTALLRPMVPLVPETLPELKATPVLVSAGNHDPIAPSQNVRELVALLRRAGGDVTVCFENAGHGLTDTTFANTQRWLAEKAK
jgi:glyoxalase family protein